MLEVLNPRGVDTFDSEIYAVEGNKEIYNTLCRLVGGEEVQIKDLANIVCNKNSEGSPILNTDLTDLNLLDIGRRELSEAYLNPDAFVNFSSFKRPDRCFTHIYPIHADICDYALAHKGEFDFVYMGVVLLNIAKDVS